MNSLTNENTRLGFIGIGNMGSRMAKRLLDHGYQLVAITTEVGRFRA